MKLTRTYTIVGFVSLAIIIIFACILWNRQRNYPPPPQIMTMPPEPLPIETQPPTTTAPPGEVNDIDIENIRVGGMTVLYPKVPVLEMQYNPRRWEFVPGAVLPGMEGRRVEDATHVISTVYPGVTVRVVDQSAPLNLEVRRDRVTLTIDLYTKRVIVARIG